MTRCRCAAETRDKQWWQRFCRHLGSPIVLTKAELYLTSPTGGGSAVFGVMVLGGRGGGLTHFHWARTPLIASYKSMCEYQLLSSPFACSLMTGAKQHKASN